MPSTLNDSSDGRFPPLVNVTSKPLSAMSCLLHSTACCEHFNAPQEAKNCRKRYPLLAKKHSQIWPAFAQVWTPHRKYAVDHFSIWTSHCSNESDTILRRIYDTTELFVVLVRSRKQPVTRTHSLVMGIFAWKHPPLDPADMKRLGNVDRYFIELSPKTWNVVSVIFVPAVSSVYSRRHQGVKDPFRQFSHCVYS